MPTLTEMKKAIKDFPHDINFMDYYLNLFKANHAKWLYVNPEKCKDSFKQCPYNHLRFICLKHFMKNGYMLSYNKDKDGYIFSERKK